MKLTTNQANALKTWCSGAVIKYADGKARREIGPAVTIAALCKRGLIVRDKRFDMVVEYSPKMMEKYGDDPGVFLQALSISGFALRGVRGQTMPFTIDTRYKLTALGVSELRLRGFFTRPPGAIIE